MSWKRSRIVYLSFLLLQLRGSSTILSTSRRTQLYKRWWDSSLSHRWTCRGADSSCGCFKSRSKDRVDAWRKRIFRFFWVLHTAIGSYAYSQSLRTFYWWSNVSIRCIRTVGDDWSFCRRNKRRLMPRNGPCYSITPGTIITGFYTAGVSIYLVSKFGRTELIERRIPAKWALRASLGAMSEMI